MNKKIQSLIRIWILILAVAFTACEGDQGEVGPAGPTGDAGENGAPGDAGENGEGYTEATSFGNILVTLTGKLPTGEDFTKEMDFKYLPSVEDIDLEFSEVFYGSGESRGFAVLREYKTSAANSAKTNAEFSFNHIGIVFSEENSVTDLEDFSFFALVTHEGTYFEINSSDFADEEYEITNISYDETTGRLTYDFSLTFLDAQEEPMTISAAVDVIVVESMEHRLN